MAHDTAARGHALVFDEGPVIAVVSQSPVVQPAGPWSYAIVFDDRTTPQAVVDPNGRDRLSFPVLSTTGPRGPQGDENVMVLLKGQSVPSDTPDFKIIYRLLEDL